MPAAAPLHFEKEAWGRGLVRVAGVDESGYGPLAGPVITAAVVLDPERPVEGVTDSKLLSRQRREEFAALIRERAVDHALGAASCREVERLNARGAVALAMRRAVSRLASSPELVLVDGFEVRELGAEQRALVRGDRRSRSIACASVLAKVTRDRLMRSLHPRYPEYGWGSNHGYGTSEHRAALARHGPTPHHRRTFAGVLQTELEMGDDAEKEG